MKIILTLNPGSTSTKLGIFSRDKKIVEKNIPAMYDEKPEWVADEFSLRLKDIETIVNELGSQYEIIAVIGRGGPLKPLPGGVYKINDKMLNDLKSAKYSNHASNLGAMLAHHIAGKLKVPSYIVDPVTVDDFDPLARISGYPGIKRNSRSHALNIRATGRKLCDREGWNILEDKFVVAHLGGGISVAAVKQGRIRDVNDGLLGMGPFSPERAGALPIGALLELSRTMDLKKLQHLLSKESGLKGYLGTADAKEVEKRINAGDEHARQIYDAMIYQINKEIGAMLAVCEYNVKSIIITGGLAHSDYIKEKLKKYIKTYQLNFCPGENELEAMADGGFRAIDGKIELKEYS